MNGIESLMDNISEVKSAYNPTPEERLYISKVYNDFIFDLSIKNQTWEVLNNRDLQHFWADCNRDYNVFVEDDPNDPVTQYASGITRDKANTFITNLTAQLLAPSVTALNESKEVDVVVSKLCRPILQWQHSNDGRPAESGELKNFRYTHKQVVEGTVHIQDDIDPETGKLSSQVIPNEEVFIPNFYQPNLQLQSHFIRAQMDTSYQEAKAEFGDLDNFQYVMPGTLGWLNQTFEFKERYKAVVSSNKVTIIRCWYPVSASDLKSLKKQGKIKSWVTQAKYFNILINGVPMFAPDNLMAYNDGFYPISKGVFEHFSPSEFYWGNSMPNKAKNDKKFLDGWKTLIRYKAKLSALPPGFNTSGQHLEGDIYVPGNIVDLPAGTDASKVFQTVQGISQGVTNGDIKIMEDTQSDLERDTISNMLSGGMPVGVGTMNVRVMQMMDENAKQSIAGFAQQIAFLQEARTFHILNSSFQFLTKENLSKLCIPDQTFDDGSTGTYEIIFQKPGEGSKIGSMTAEQRKAHSYSILDEQGVAKKMGVTKQSVYIDSEYILHLDYYAKANAESVAKDTTALREARAQMKWETYSQNPIFNVKKAARKLVRELGDSDDMVNDQPAQAPGMPGQQPQGQGGAAQPTQPGSKIMNGMLGRAQANFNPNIK